MQNFGARDTLVFWFLFRTDQLHHSIFVQISFVCRLRFWGGTYTIWRSGFHDYLLRNHVYDLSYSTADRRLDVSFVYWVWKMGSGHLGTGIMIEMGYGYDHRTGLGSNWTH
jgi:hypothetical protein